MVQRLTKSARKWFITNGDITKDVVSLHLNVTLLNFTVISHMWSNFPPTKECQFPIAITYPSSCLGKLPWKTKLRSFGCLESEQGNWIVLFHQVTAAWWVTLSLFRNLSSKWNRHSSCQLSVFPNCLCPGVDWEDIIFPMPPVWLTRQMTQFLLQTLEPSFNKPSALASQRLKVLLKLSWTPRFHTRTPRSGEVNGLPLAALAQGQNPSPLPQPGVLLTLTPPLFLIVQPHDTWEPLGGAFSWLETLYPRLFDCSWHSEQPLVMGARNTWCWLLRPLLGR